MNVANPQPTIPPALRSDLEWIERDGPGSGRWIARDPVSLEYFSFSDVERKVALRLDGRSGAVELLDWVRPLDQHGTWTADRLRTFVARLDHACLLRPVRAGTGRRLWRRERLESRRGWIAWLASPLVLRVPLFDPSPWLRHCGGPAWLLLNRWMAAFWAVALVVVAVQVLPEMLAAGQLTTSFRFLGGENAICLMLTWAVVKSLHELGHLLACRRWRAECHECGVWLLFLVPSLYCDTSDGWKLSSRWRRAAIAAAGVYVEMILATLAGAAWLWLQPGLLRDLATNVMVICTVGTLLLNGNPLLRYDGYYILSDLWNVPNLADQARESVRQIVMGWLTGTGLPRERWDAPAGWLAVYGVLSWAYRQFVVFLILWTAWRMLDEWGLPLAGLIVVATMLAGIGLGWMRLLWGMALEVVMDGRGRLARLALAGLLLAVAVWSLFHIPLPSGIVARGHGVLAGSLPVFAPQSGELVELAAGDRRVAASELLARIDAPEKRLALLDLRHRIATLVERRNQLELHSVDDPRAALELPGLAEQIADLERQRVLLDAELSAMQVLAPREGWYWQAHVQPATALADQPGELATMDRRPLREPGSVVQRGELLGWIADQSAMEVRMVVPEHDFERIRVGMPAEVRWDSFPREPVAGTVRSLAAEPVGTVPAALAGDPRLVAVRDATGNLVPAKRSYEVVIGLNGGGPGVPQDALATVRIDTGSRTAVQLLRRLVQRSLLPVGQPGQ